MSRFVAFIRWGSMSVVLVLANWGILAAGEPDGITPAPDEAVPAVAEQAAADADLAEIEALIQQLGDSVYIDRELATKRLMEIGVAAEPMLTEAVQHPDAEIRHRAIRILSYVVEADFERRLKEFAADVDGSKNLTLPGWEKFRKRVGSDKTARLLFVEVQRSEPDLMYAYEKSPDRLTRVFEQRCAALQQAMRHRNGNIRHEVSLGSLVGLLLVASDPDTKTTTQSNQYLYSFLHRPAFQTGVNGGSYKKILLELLGSWIATAGETNTSVDYQKLILAMRYNLKQGLKPALGMAKRAGSPPYYRLYGMLAVAKLGSRNELDELAPMLKDKTVCTRRKINKEEVTIEVRDAALLAMVHITEQKPAEYGFNKLQPNSQYVYNPSSLYFDSGKDRDKALEKWKNWAEENLNKSAASDAAKPGDSAAKPQEKPEAESSDESPEADQPRQQNNAANKAAEQQELEAAAAEN